MSQITPPEERVATLLRPSVLPLNEERPHPHGPISAVPRPETGPGG